MAAGGQLTRDAVLAMPASVTLDALVAEHVFGWTRRDRTDLRGRPWTVMIPPESPLREAAFRVLDDRTVEDFIMSVGASLPRPSISIADAWKVVEAFDRYVVRWGFGDSEHICELTRRSPHAFGRATGPTACMAISRASLIAVLKLW